MCCAPVAQVVDLGRVAASAHRTHNAVFVHLADALWTPDIHMSDEDKREGISLSHLTSERMALRCTFCGQGGGAVMCVPSGPLTHRHPPAVLLAPGTSPLAFHALLRVFGVACSQCSEAECCTAFHILCAHEAGCHCSLEAYPDTTAFCLRHSATAEDCA